MLETGVLPANAAGATSCLSSAASDSDGRFAAAARRVGAKRQGIRERSKVATNKTRDKVKGKAVKAKGKARVAASRAVGNETQEAKGEKDVAKGEVINKKGHVKDLGS